MTKAKEIAASIMDNEDEPTAETYDVCTELQLAKGLNFYAARSDSEQLKRYSIIWAETNAPHLLERIKQAPGYCFITYGAVARLHTRGFKLKQSHIERVHAHFEKLPIVERALVIEKAPKPKAVRTNSTLLSLDDVLDAVLSGKAANVAFDPKDSIPEIILHCKEKLKDLEDPEGYPKSAVKALRAVYEDTLKKCSAVRTSKVSLGRAKKSKPPEMIASKVKFQKEDASLNLVSLRPSEIVGSSKVYVYDTSRRRLYIFRATDSGFSFKGTTLCNVNMTDSQFKMVRKPETVLKLNARPSMRDLNEIFKNLTTKETAAPATRLSDSCIIVNYSK